MIVGQGSTEDIDAPSIRSYQLPTYTVEVSNGDVNLGSTAQITDDLVDLVGASKMVRPNRNSIH